MSYTDTMQARVMEQIGGYIATMPEAQQMYDMGHLEGARGMARWGYGEHQKHGWAMPTGNTQKAEAHLANLQRAMAQNNRNVDWLYMAYGAINCAEWAVLTGEA